LAKRAPSLPKLSVAGAQWGRRVKLGRGGAGRSGVNVQVFGVARLEFGAAHHSAARRAPNKAPLR
jgi:hypothetical protein